MQLNSLWYESVDDWKTESGLTAKMSPANLAYVLQLERQNFSEADPPQPLKEAHRSMIRFLGPFFSRTQRQFEASHWGRQKPSIVTVVHQN